MCLYWHCVCGTYLYRMKYNSYKYLCVQTSRQWSLHYAMFPKKHHILLGHERHWDLPSQFTANNVLINIMPDIVNRFDHFCMPRFFRSICTLDDREQTNFSVKSLNGNGNLILKQIGIWTKYHHTCNETTPNYFVWADPPTWIVTR